MRINTNKAIFLLAAGSAATTKQVSAFAVRGVGIGLTRLGGSMEPSLPVVQQQHQTRLFMNFMKDIFSSPQVTSKDDILAAFKNPKAVVIDVRSPGEITSKVDAKNWINVPGTPFDCPDLAPENASKLLPDKTAPVILYCASGKRSQKAADILKEQNYEQVFNAGGIGSLDYLPIKSA